MMATKSKTLLRLCGAGAAALLAAPCAQAVIKIEFPVSRMYRESKVVRSAQVVSVDAGSGLVEARPVDTFKGGQAPVRLRLVITGPTNVIGRVAVKQQVAMFLSESENGGAAIVHLADTWLLAEGVPGATPPALRIVQGYDGARAFPGRTAALVRLLAAMKDGGEPLEDKLDPACLAGAAREVCNLGVRPTFLESADLDGDTRADLLAGTGDGVRLLLATGKGYTNVTSAWGVQGVRAEHAAVGDVNGDGKPDVLLGTNLLVRQGGALARTAPAPDLGPETEWLAVALADAGGDRKADIVLLRRTGELVVLTNPGATGAPWPRVARNLWGDGTAAAAARFSADWGEAGQLHVLVARGGGITRYAVAAAGEPATPFLQLTGTEWNAALAVDGQPAGAIQGVAIDCDGNGKQDWVLLTGKGGVTLLNRGFGTFCADYTVHHRVRPTEPKAALPFSITPGAFLAGGQLQADDLPRQNLLVLTEDGRLFEIPNLPPL